MKPSNLNYKFKERLALTIMLETGNDIPEASEPWVLPIESEYKRIQEKVSDLSSRNRKDLSSAYESLLEMKKAQAETEAKETKEDS